MKPLIALTDFSPVSLNAVNYAADMAVALNTQLLIVNVCVQPMAFSEVPYPATGISDMINNAKSKLLKLYAKLAIRTDNKIQITTEVRVGSLVPETETIIATQKPYAVVVGTQGSSSIERLIFGRNTVHLVKQLSAPVIVVPPEARFGKLRKIGLACDLEDVKDTIPVNEIKTLVNSFKAELHVLHVSEAPGKKYTAGKSVELHWLRELFNDSYPIYHFIRDNDIEHGLADYAARFDLDLLIIIPKKHTIVNRLLRKTHSKKLVLHTQLPAMTLHEDFSKQEKKNYADPWLR